MKKITELTNLKEDLHEYSKGIDEIIKKGLKKVKKECNNLITEEKHKLIEKIAEDLKINSNDMKVKFLKPNELSFQSTSKTIKSDIEKIDVIFDKTEINNKIYYYVPIDYGKVYNSEYELVGTFINGDIIFD